MTRTTLLLALLLGYFCGCISRSGPAPLTAEEASKVEYGRFPENYKELIHRYIVESSSTPVELRTSEPFKGYIQQGPTLGGKVLVSGYFVDVWVRPKGTRQGDAQEKQIGVVIKGDEVLMQFSPEEMQKVVR
jgi:hypothetical protein